MLMYHCQKSFDGEAFSVWTDMKVALLLWALSYHAQGMMEPYLLTYPIACIGESVAIQNPSTSAVGKGHLCRWVPEKGSEWQCDISVRGEMKSIKFDRNMLAASPERLFFDGEIGRLHQDLTYTAVEDRHLSVGEDNVIKVKTSSGQ